jgi:hypothetical protein
MSAPTYDDLTRENAELRKRLDEAEGLLWEALKTTPGAIDGDIQRFLTSPSSAPAPAVPGVMTMTDCTWVDNDAIAEVRKRLDDELAEIWKRLGKLEQAPDAPVAKPAPSSAVQYEAERAGKPSTFPQPAPSSTTHAFVRRPVSGITYCATEVGYLEVCGRHKDHPIHGGGGK